jgi:hypothetical protein
MQEKPSGLRFDSFRLLSETTLSSFNRNTCVKICIYLDMSVFLLKKS